MARSINQNANAGGLPNFRNLGILLRIGIIVNAVAFAAAILRSMELRTLWTNFIEFCALIEPLLILSLLASPR